MKKNNEFILSLDIGGANTKFSLLFLDFEKYIEETEEEDRHFYTLPLFQQTGEDTHERELVWL